MLPKLDVPLYEITLPLLKKKVRFRPFLVKEEKILLMAAESDDGNSIVLAIKQILNNCLQDNIDVDSLPILDFEYLFMHIRARSVGEIVDMQYKCNNTIEDEDNKTKCNNLVKLSFNALEVEPDITNSETKIELTPKLGVMLKYPTFKNINTLSEIENVSPVDMVIKTIINSIDYVYDQDNVYYAKDLTEPELIDFIDSFTKEQFARIQEFFDNIPKLRKTVQFKCSKCGHEEDLVLEGIQSFFA
jgi:hypothetical protein